MILLVLARRDAVEARRSGKRLVQAYHASSGVLSNHEAAVEAWVGNEEAWKTASARNEAVDAALADVGELAQCYSEEVHRHSDGRAMEVAGADD